MVSARQAIEQAERTATLRPGVTERFAGWGVMGLPFQSGDVFASRCFPASSVGEGYKSVWYRDPAGRWTFFADVDPHFGCTRFFGSDAERAVKCAVEVEWTGDSELRISVPEASLVCDISLGHTIASRAMTAMGAAMPEWAWANPRVLGAMSAMAGPVLRAGKLCMAGYVSNGQRFIANPRRLWVIQSARLQVGDRVVTAIGAVHPQAQLGDFRIPQRGILAIGNAAFDTFDPEKHSGAVCREPA